MSENSIERLAGDEQATPVEAKPEPAAAPVPAVRRGGSALALLALLVAAGALAGGGWLWQQQQALNARLTASADTNRSLSEALARAEAEARRIAETDSAARSALASRLDQLETGRDALSAALSGLDAKVAANLEKRPESWRAAEAEYLVRLAALRVSERDSQTAVQLLQNADARIRDLPAAASLRAALAQDVAALRTVPAPDVQGIVLKIESLLPRIPGLLATKPVEVEPSAEQRAEAELQSPWQRSLQSVWQALKRDWIEVRHYQGVSPELELPEVRHYLDQNLALALQQAEWAASRGDAALYQGALGRAQTWIGRYFEADAAETRGFLATVAELKAIDVAPILPAPDKSLAAARDLVNGQSAVPVTDTPSAPETDPDAKP